MEARNHISLFSGIGGFDLAAEWMGWNNLAQVEKDPFCLQVLEKRFPTAKRYTDVKEFDGTPFKGSVFALSGGFPCQPYSTAGKQLGKADDRHLWPEYARIIREISPRYVIGENVRGLISWNGGMVFEEVQADLEAAGYEVWPFLLPAAGIGAPHRRDRIWFIGHSYGRRSQDSNSHSERQEARNRIFEEAIRCRNTADSNCDGHRRNYQSCKAGRQAGEGQREGAQREWIRPNLGRISATTTTSHSSQFPQRKSANQINPEPTGWNARTEPGSTCGRGASANSDGNQRPERGMHQARCEQTERYTRACGACASGNTWQDFPTQSPVCGGNDGIPNRVDRLKSLGNAIVPQVVYQIFRAIEQFEQQKA